MTHKQWFNNVLHLHLVPKEEAKTAYYKSNQVEIILPWDLLILQQCK